MTLAEMVAAEMAAPRYEWPHYRVTGYAGIAWNFLRPETAPDDDTVWTGIEPETGRALMVMVGDDRKFSIDPADVMPLAETAFCHECGQIGCTAYAEVD